MATAQANAAALLDQLLVDVAVEPAATLTAWPTGTYAFES
jgi:hypothetical protein